MKYYSDDQIKKNEMGGHVKCMVERRGEERRGEERRGVHSSWVRTLEE